MPSIQDYWRRQLRQQPNRRYRIIKIPVLQEHTHALFIPQAHVSLLLVVRRHL